MRDKRLARSPRAQRALADLTDRSLNFDPDELAAAGPHNGWHVDDYREELPAESSGEPEDGATFDVAQRLMSDYAFADPSIIRAVYDPASGLADRNMLLQARFGPLRFFLGCRVGAITDETRTVDGRKARVWVGATARWRATSSAARWTTRSGSGSTTARSSFASTSCRDGRTSATRSSGWASGSSAAASSDASHVARASGWPSSSSGCGRTSGRVH